MSKTPNKEVQAEYQELEISIIESNEVIKEFTYALDDFSKEVDPKHDKDHRSYVYALCEKVGESLIPFYIGEGKGSRVWSHELETSDQIRILEEELAKEGRLDELEKRKEELSEKIHKIEEINKRHGKIVKYIIKWGMTSKEAFMAESALINLLRIGGLKFDSSCSDNKDKLTNKVQGHQSEGEKQTGLTKAWTVDEFCEEFAKKPLYYEDLQKRKVKALLININNAYPECLKYPVGEKRKNAIKDTACGNWKIKIESFEKLGIEYVFATVQARVVGIYKIKEVDGKKIHCMYESTKENSEYPHGEGIIHFRNEDYELAKSIVTVADSKGKHPSQVELDDMPSDFRSEYIKNVEKEKDPRNEFKNILGRTYMILEDISEDDPNYEEYIEYLYRRIIHSDRYVKITRLEKKKERDKAIKEGKKKRPNPDSVTHNIYGKGNPIRYIDIDGKIKK
ncbi:MAG: GIY-YIG nuclease family protein [Lachnospiraceae bacterium]|nr:GIY-YIG nuclease family protein [Lachnospiraceae bacterium]